MPIAALRAPLIATVSLVLALGAVVGPSEREAFAQQPNGRPAKSKKDKKKEADAEEKKEEKKEEEEKKKAGDPPPPPEEKKELDTSVEAAKAVYISGDFAFTRADLGAISDKTGLDRTAANGLLYGLSTGLRLKDLRFGVRWHDYDTTEFSLWSLALSAGYGLPFRPVSPVFSAHVGYVWDHKIEPGLFRRSIPDGTILPPDVDVKGLLVGVDANASYWVTQWFRLGAFIGADFMFLSREQAPAPKSIYGPSTEAQTNPLYTESGSGVGLNFNVGLRGAFDIPFK